ncbi:MAG: hypothetical protein ACKOXP_07270 [Flavobacteriales bacterium]
MKRILQLYFLLYLLSGGFRHILFEEEYFSTLHHVESSAIVGIAALMLYLLAIAYLLSSKSLIVLMFYIIMLLTDIYIQNWVKFESSVILIHQLPLFAFLYLNENKRFLSEAVGRYVLLLFLSVGFVLSGFSKIITGWLSFESLNLKSHIHSLQIDFHLPVYLNESSLYFIPNGFWKTLDVLVVIFQCSFIQFFFSLKGLKWRFFGLIIFHVSISLVLGIHVFYPYFLVYILLFIPWEEGQFDRVLNRLYQSAGSVIFLTFVWFRFDTNALIRTLGYTFYLHVDFYLTLILAVVFLFILVNFTIEKRSEAS